MTWACDRLEKQAAMNGMTGFASSFSAVLDLALHRLPSPTTSNVAAMRRAFLLRAARNLACLIGARPLGP